MLATEKLTNSLIKAVVFEDRQDRFFVAVPMSGLGTVRSFFYLEKDISKYEKRFSSIEMQKPNMQEFKSY